MPETPPPVKQEGKHCMHPYTVYGIETTEQPIVVPFTFDIACTLIPFTVLKQQFLAPGRRSPCAHCMHPYTVYGIETQICLRQQTVMELNCMHPYTVYGIETTP